jgi:hypothetical protein
LEASPITKACAPALGFNCRNGQYQGLGNRLDPFNYTFIWGDGSVHSLGERPRGMTNVELITMARNFIAGGGDRRFANNVLWTWGVR